MYARISQNFTGQQGNVPRIVPVQTDATYNQLTAAGFINPYMPSGFSFYPTDILAITYANNQSGFFRLSFANQTITIISDENDIVGDLTVDGNITATGNISAGESGDSGYLESFPATASKGSLRVQGVANVGNTVTTVSNASMAQATTITIPDPGAATASTLLSPLAAPDMNANIVRVDTAVSVAALNSGAVTIFTSGAGKQYKILNMWVNSGGTNFSSVGGDRLMAIGDGITVYSVIPAASLQTLANTAWGATGLPFPASAPVNTSTAVAANITASNSGGATNYTTGTVTISMLLQRVA